MKSKKAQNKNEIVKPIEWLFNRRLRLFYHLLFWIFIYLDEILSVIGLTEPIENHQRIILEVLVDASLVYLIIYYLYPKFLVKGKSLKFFVFASIAILINVFITTSLYDIYADYFESDFRYFSSIIISSFVTTILIVGFALGIKIFKSYILNEVRLQRLKNDNLNTELTYLKDQINPHFLFNSLNNIYILNMKSPEKAGESILLLSDMLRYQLYDSAKEKVFLDDEIKNLKNFLELDSLRKENLKINFETAGDTANIQVSPYLFMPFIENSLKHTQSSDNEPGYLNVIFASSDKKQITFKLTNSKPKNKLITKVGGIGLKNVKRRLELVYPKKHELQIDNSENYYQSILKIRLDE